VTDIEIELSGWDAFQDGKQPGDSPYAPGTRGDSAWRSGWLTAYTVAIYRLRPWSLDCCTGTVH
jgi:hypothetical protein